MARQMHPVCRLCRREGMKLYLKGEKCYTPKCPVDRRAYPPGMHGKKANFRRKESDYATQLREKQRARRIYSVLERQFRRYFSQAARAKGLTGATLLIMLESRLDNTVYRLGFADSRAQARQLVRHGHFNVNAHKTDIPSYQVKPGDVIAVRDNHRNNAYFKERADILGKKRPPTWLSVDPAGLSGRVLTAPTRDQVDIPLNEQLIVEYYSR